jgi:hypothetical protein
MLKTGRLPTVQALVERYVHRVIVSGEQVEIQFNLTVSNRVVTYSVSSTPNKKEIPQPSLQRLTGIFSSSQRKMLATFGGELSKTLTKVQYLAILPPGRLLFNLPAVWYRVKLLQ